MGASAAVTFFHWAAAVTTVPFGLMALFAPNPEKVKFNAKNVALPLPTFVLHIVGTFCHLTMVTHICICLHFVLALLRDHGVLPAETTEGEDLFFSTLQVASLFVCTVFWLAMVVDPMLFIEADMLGFPSDAPRSKVYPVLFRMLWAPASQAESGFCIFMRYIHTVCTLLVTVDASLVPHPPRDLQLEFRSLVSYCTKYLVWNLFSWWLLRRPPYPWQRGALKAVANHGLCYLWAFALLAFARAWRAPDAGASTRLLLLLPLASFIWASHGGPPFKSLLARRHGGASVE